MSKPYLLQPILAPDHGRPPGLYLQDPETAPNCTGAMPWHLVAGEALATNTYLNAFFLGFWRAEACLGRIGLHVGTTGLAVVEIFCLTATGDRLRLLGQSVDADTTLWLDALPEEAVRLFCRLTVAQDLSITDLAWATDAPPLHSPTLSIGLCSFNREGLLLQTLETLAGQCAKTPEIKSIWVINQGKPFSEPRFDDLCAAHPIHIVEQGNHGGCGGFTRSMFESLKAEPATSHHLLMDDDIVLDPRMLDRVVRFLAYRAHEIALGGQMLEIENPTCLHEAGGRLHPLWYVDSVGHGRDMRTLPALQLFDQPLEVDYNAWWFCVIPTALIRRIGLPPPLFIRGDDVDYGCRMAAADVPTRPLPGCMVWHESFAYKTSDWLLYYDLRNRLILAAMHPDLVKPPDALYLLGFVMSILFQHRYRATSVALRAIEDALSPPADVLGPDSATRHAALLDWLDDLPAPERLPAVDLPETEPGSFRPLDPSVPAMIWMCVKGVVLQHLRRLGPRRRLLRFPHQPLAPAVLVRDYVVAVNPDETEFTVHRNNLRQMWTLIFRTFAVCWRHLRENDARAAAYRAEIDQMRKATTWRRVFDTPPPR